MVALFGLGFAVFAFGLATVVASVLRASFDYESPRNELPGDRRRIVPAKQDPEVRLPRPDFGVA
jgi:hypothetical protein